MALGGGNAAFLAFGSSGQAAIYVLSASTLSRVADLNTAIPDGTGNFTAFDLPALSGGKVTPDRQGKRAGKNTAIWYFTPTCR